MEIGTRYTISAKKGTVGGNSEQVIEKEQISAADDRDIIEAALQAITIDKNNVAKYIEKEHNSAQTYSIYK